MLNGLQARLSLQRASLHCWPREELRSCNQLAPKHESFRFLVPSTTESEVNEMADSKVNNSIRNRTRESQQQTNLAIVKHR